MGYNLHITRAEDWLENEDSWITPEEWDAVVRADSELEFREECGDHFAEWVPDRLEGGAWLDWYKGNVYAKNPSTAFIRKMCDIATRLNAKVQGDDGERYPEAFEVAKRPRRKPRRLAAYSLVLSGVSVAGIVFSFWIEKNYTRVAPYPLWIAFTMSVPMCLGMVAWLLGAVLACGSWFVEPKNRRLSIIASIVSAAFVLAALLTE